MRLIFFAQLVLFLCLNVCVSDYYNDLRPFVFSLNACEVIKVSILPKRKQINKRNWQSCNKIFSFQSRILKLAIGHTGLSQQLELNYKNISFIADSY